MSYDVIPERELELYLYYTGIHKTNIILLINNIILLKADFDIHIGS